MLEQLQPIKSLAKFAFLSGILFHVIAPSNSKHLVNTNDVNDHPNDIGSISRSKASISSKKLLQKVLWEGQSWFASSGSLSGAKFRQMTQMFGFDVLVEIPPRVIPDEATKEGNGAKVKSKTGSSWMDDIDKPTPALIAENGYPVEVHNVTTEDGYILQMHRIPYGLAPNSGEGEGSKTPVYLQHGLLCSSSDWVITGPGKGLAYILADAGYDVWMGNVRGNTYSRRHEALSPDQAAFWEFSWDQHAEFDVPAQMDKITKVSGKEKMFYVGHSMGTTVFWAMSNVRPEYRERIKAMFALAPVARVDHMLSPVALLAPFVNELKQITDGFGVTEFLPSTGSMRWLRTLFCDGDFVTSDLCHNILFLFSGFNPDQLNSTMVPIILGHSPAGTSTRTVIHYAQEVNVGRFQFYDFGKSGNLEHYGTEQPPEYHPEMVTSPVVTFWSDNDWLAQPKDVEWLESKLPNVKSSNRVNFDNFNHLDFLWGIDAPRIIYSKIVSMMHEFDADS